MLSFLHLLYFDVFIGGIHFFMPLCPIGMARAEQMGTLVDPTNGRQMEREM